MRFWDASALVPLFVNQQTSERMSELRAQNNMVVAWSLSELEFHSAIRRLRREGQLSDADTRKVFKQFEAFWNEVRTIDLIDAVKLRARRILALHSLRASDAVQLGAALVAAEDDARRIEFVCLDGRLADAARHEGFRILP